jgi:hypothetical protein
MSAGHALRGFSESSRQRFWPVTGAPAGEGSTSAGGRAWGAPVRLAIALVVGLRVVYGVAAALFALGPLHPEDLLRSAPLSPSLLVSPWQRFDALWYQSIAAHGYGAHAGDAAFLPLYPLLEGAAGHLAGGAALGGLLVSTVALGVALVLLARFAEPVAGRGVARWAAVLLAVSPTAVFLFAGYAEGLFLAMVLGVFLLARRGRLGWAGALAGIAVLTRDQGLFLAPALLAGLALGGGRRRSAAAWAGAAVKICAPSAVALAGMLVAWEWMGSGLGPWHSEALWGNRLSLPWATLVDAVQAVARGRHAEELLNLAAVAFTIGTLPWVWRRLGASMGVYQLLTLLVILCRETDITPLTSADRLILALPGVFIAVAAFLERREPPVRWAVAGVSFVASLCVLGRFVAFHFVG